MTGMLGVETFPDAMSRREDAGFRMGGGVAAPDDPLKTSLSEAVLLFARGRDGS